MKKTYSSLLSCCLLAFLFHSCYAPQAVIRLSPEEGANVFWHNGQAIAEQKQDSVIARAAFSHANQEYLIFDIEVFNETEHPILVTPEVMLIKTANSGKIRAANPERILLSMEIEASRQEANAKNALVVGGVIAVGAVVAAIAIESNDDNSTNDEYYGSSDGYTTLDASLDVLSAVSWGLSFRQDAILSVEPHELPNPTNPLFWEEIVLRRTTLRPGEHIRGLVAFPRVDRTETLDLTIPVDGLSFDFNFAQRLYQP